MPPPEVLFPLGVAAGAFGLRVIQIWLSGRQLVPAAAEPFVTERELENRRLAAENAALSSQMADVRDRLATLERLAVDKPTRLADEIEALRA